MDVVTDAGLSGSKTDCPGLTDALARMHRHGTDLLVVAKLDRPSQSIRDGIDVIDGANRQGRALVYLGSSVDMNTSAREMVAKGLFSAAQHERRLIGVRDREGFAEAKARDVKLGAQTAYPDVPRSERLAALTAARPAP